MGKLVEVLLRDKRLFAGTAIACDPKLGVTLVGAYEADGGTWTLKPLADAVIDFRPEEVEHVTFLVSGDQIAF